MREISRSGTSPLSEETTFLFEWTIGSRIFLPYINTDSFFLSLSSKCSTDFSSVRLIILNSVLLNNHGVLASCEYQKYQNSIGEHSSFGKFWKSFEKCFDTFSRDFICLIQNQINFICLVPVIDDSINSSGLCPIRRHESHFSWVSSSPSWSSLSSSL